MKLSVAARSERGNPKIPYGDSIFTFVHSLECGSLRALLIVADGMGKGNESKISSQLAIDTIYAGLQEFLNQDKSGVAVAPNIHLEELLKACVETAHRTVYNHWHQLDSEAATTATCVLIDNQMATIANAGDSRVYHLRNGELKQITEDHTVISQLVRLGKLSPEEAHRHPQRNLLYSILGYGVDAQVDVFRQPLQAGDQLLLCSDGLYAVLDETEWGPCLRNTASPDVKVDRLVNAAKEVGLVDDISVIVAKVEENNVRLSR